MSSSSDPQDPPPRPARPAPARPALSATVPSPLDALHSPPPGSMAASLSLWVASFVMGLLALALAVTGLEDRRTELRTTVRSDDPKLTPASVESVVNTTLWVALAGLLAVMVVGLVLVLVARRRRRWARALLTLVALAGVVVALVAGGTLAGDDPLIRNYVVLSLGLQGLLALLAVLMMFLPSANAWFRGRRR